MSMATVFEVHLLDGSGASLVRRAVFEPRGDHFLVTFYEGTPHTERRAVSKNADDVKEAERAATEHASALVLRDHEAYVVERIDRRRVSTLVLAHLCKSAAS